MLKFVTFEMRSYLKMFKMIADTMYRQSKGETNTREQFFDFKKKKEKRQVEFFACLFLCSLNYHSNVVFRIDRL